jgi:DNA-directed RNA polymerase subunit M/transcription elongation factor TFIIS
MYNTVIRTTLDIYNRKYAKSSLKQIKYNVQDILSFINDNTLVENDDKYSDLVIRCVLYITYYQHFEDDLFVLMVSDTNSDTYIKLCKLVRVNYFNAILSKLILAEYGNIPSHLNDILYTIIDCTYTHESDNVCMQVLKGLRNKYGQLPKSLIIYVINGDVLVSDMIKNKIYTDYKKYKFRNIIRKQITDIISKFNNTNAEQIAIRIERSCYNKAIDQCKESSESYIRQWDSSMWINLYSAKTGIVIKHIDPESTVVEQYGSLIPKILSNEINIDNIGYMSEQELCPIANQGIRDNINHRMNQKIEIKTSTMFKCPKCGARDAEYKSVQLRGPDEPTTYVCRCNKCRSQFNG